MGRITFSLNPTYLSVIERVSFRSLFIGNEVLGIVCHKQ